MREPVKAQHLTDDGWVDSEYRPRKTLLDEFAMAALIGYCNGSDVIGDPEFYARECYRIANAMMAERARQAKGEGQ